MGSKPFFQTEFGVQLCNLMFEGLSKCYSRILLDTSSFKGCYAFYLLFYLLFIISLLYLHCPIINNVDANKKRVIFPLFSPHYGIFFQRKMKWGLMSEWQNRISNRYLSLVIQAFISSGTNDCSFCGITDMRNLYFCYVGGTNKSRWQACLCKIGCIGLVYVFIR